MIEPSLLLEVYDKTLLRVGQIAAPTEISGVLRHNLASDCTFAVPLQHEMLPQLLARGSRAVVTHQPANVVLLSGALGKRDGKLSDESMAFTVDDDFNLGQRMLGWAVPTADLAGQGTGTYDLTGPAETVARSVLLANAARLGLPMISTPDLGRGSPVTGSWRFHQVYDVLLPLLEQGGIGLTIRQAPAVRVPGGGMRSPGLLLDVYVPQTWPREISVEGGTIVDWTYAEQKFSASRWVQGSQTVDAGSAARTFSADVDTVEEGDWGALALVEEFLDTSTTDPAATLKAFTDARAKGASSRGFSVTLPESGIYGYGVTGGLSVGDRVRMQVGVGDPVTDVLREAAFAVTREQGLTFTPAVGEVVDPHRNLALLIGDLFRHVRDQAVR